MTIVGRNHLDPGLGEGNRVPIWRKILTRLEHRNLSAVLVVISDALAGRHGPDPDGEQDAPVPHLTSRRNMQPQTSS